MTEMTRRRSSLLLSALMRAGRAIHESLSRAMASLGVLMFCLTVATLGQQTDTDHKSSQPAAELKRLREQHQRLKGELEKLRHTRMLVPNPLNGQGSVTIAGRHYWLEYLKKAAAYTHAPHYRPTGDPNLAYYFRNGRECLVCDPRKMARPREIASPWPLEAVSVDGSRAIALGGRRAYGDKRIPRLVDLKANEVLASFEELTGCSRWLFAPGGKYALPLAGSATGGVPYVEVAKKEVRLIDFEGKANWVWYFSGVRLSDAKTLLLFARSSYDTEGKRVHRRVLVRWPMDSPDQMSVAEDQIGVSTVYAATNTKLLCSLLDGRVALLSADGKKLLAGSDVSDTRRDRIKWLGFAPRGNEIYVLGESTGLHVRNADTLKLVASLGVGGSSNAYTIGVTFSEDGKYAYVATPYGYHFSVIDTQKHELIAKVALSAPAAGVLLWPWEPEEGASEKRGLCLVISTMLPFE